MKTVWMLSLALFAFQTSASEFSNIKLTPEFEASLLGNNSEGPQLLHADKPLQKSFSKSVSLQPEQSLATNKFLRSTLLDADLSREAKGLIPPLDGEESPLLEEIRIQLEQSHQGLGMAQVAQLNSLNQQFNLGSQNFSGYSWQKPFGTVDIHVDRQVIPPALIDRWMVHDTFTVTVKATTFLEKLKEAGLTNMSSVEIGAFAGISFQRVYTYDHFANSYQEGLTADFTKLFLPFLKFSQSGMLSMGDNEVIKREDLWTLKAGAIVTTPPMYGFSVSGGVLAQADLTQTVAIESAVPENSSAKRYGLAVISKKAVTAGATASLQLDFFKLMQLTLLRYDLAYTYSSAKAFTLGVTAAQYQKITSNPEENSEFKKLLTGFGDIKLLEPYVVLLTDTETQKLESQGSVLLWGRTKKSGKEIISNIKDGYVHLFHKDYSRSVKYVQNLLSRIYSAIFYKLLKLPMGVQNTAIYTKEVELEYKVTHPQATDPSVVRLNSTEEFSFDLVQSYEAFGTVSKSEKRYKADIIWFIDEFTTLPKSLVTAFEKDELRGPVRVESSLKIGKPGFDFFIQRPLSQLFTEIARVCGSKKSDQWTSDSKRADMLAAKQSGNEKCVKDLGTSAVEFLSDYQANHSKPAIAKFSKFLKAYYKLTENVNDLTALFGSENVFLLSKIEATSPIGTNFTQTVSHGQFRGLGVIDNFNQTAVRAPASISE